MRNLLVTIFIATLFVAGNLHAADEQIIDGLLSVGRSHGCAANRTEIKCWPLGELGFGEHLESKIPFKNPYQMDVGDNYACALDEDGVKCWGPQSGSDRKIGLLQIEGLKNPRQVSVADSTACVLDDNSVKCWGKWWSTNENIPPQMKNPFQVAVGDDYACALDDNGVKCWGKPAYRKNPIVEPKLVNPVQVVIGFRSTCSLDDEGVKCWGRSFPKCNGCDLVDEDSVRLLGDLGHPVKIYSKAYSGYICAWYIDNSIKCTNEAYSSGWYKEQYPSSILERSALSVGRKVCELNRSGVECWSPSSNSNFRSEQAPLGFNFFIKRTPVQIELDKYFNPVRRRWVQPLRDEYNSLISESLLSKKIIWLTYALMGPAVESADSSIFLETIIPNYKRVISYLSDLYTYYSVRHGFKNMEDHKESRSLALASIQGTLNVLNEYMGAINNSEILEGLRLVGQAKADPMNNSRIQNLLSHLDSMKTEKELLQSNTKTKFLIPTLDRATEFLTMKVR